jgi:hypothetical protein
MIPTHFDPISDELPSGFIRPQPITDHQACLFHVSLSEAIAKLGVSPDDLRRWHERGWLSFDEKLSEDLDEFEDPKIYEIQIVRDIARSGLADAQVEVLLATLPKPFAFHPDRLVFSFRHGWVYVAPPADPPEPSEVIEVHLDEWMAACDEDTLENLRERVNDALEACVENGHAER